MAERSWWRGAWLAWGLILAGSAWAAAPGDKGSFSVLVLDQGDSTRPAYQAFMRAFQESLSAESALHLRIHEENLRLADFDSPSYRDSLADWLRRKYADETIHCLVAGGAKAVDVALELRQELWPSAKLVYAGISTRLASRLEAAGRITGLWIDLDPGATLEAALRMFPSARHVAWISNDTFYPDVESESRDAFQRTADRFGVKVWPINSTNLRETRASLARLPEQAIAILSIGAYQKEDQRWVSLQEAMEELQREERVPMFVQSETLIGQGAVGGVCYLPGAMGVEVAGLVAQVLQSAPSSLPAPRVSRATRLIFDWQQLARWGVDPQSVPAGSEVRHRPTTVWREYRGRLIAGGVTLLVQTGLLGWLLWERRHRRRNEVTALRLGRQLLSAHEEERRRVGRELHDDVSQRIARLAIDTHRLE
ncbi:MAG: ABC transporter substrate-binding protein, partial [Verrucomicrobiota bacterium]